MIAPVCEQNAIGRCVYLPEDMMLLRFKGTELTEEKVLEKGHHFIETALDEVTIYLRKGHVLPLAAGGEYVEETDWENLELLRFSDSAVYELYDDDGQDSRVTLEGHLRRV